MGQCILYGSSLATHANAPLLVQRICLKISSALDDLNQPSPFVGDRPIIFGPIDTLIHHLPMFAGSEDLPGIGMMRHHNYILGPGNL
ncbi:hypothetical protein RY27_18775 [Litorilinea aerophila]|nr:hypothetical protein RY27_18775 [Litorilinea aerophila]